MELGAITRGEYRNLIITDVGAKVLKGAMSVEIRSDRLVIKKKMVKASNETEKRVDFDQKIFDFLRELRKELADRDNVPAYIVFSDKTLKEIAVKRPVSKSEMLDINGVGEVKFERYGKIFLEKIKEVDCGKL